MKLKLLFLFLWLVIFTYGAACLTHLYSGELMYAVDYFTIAVLLFLHLRWIKFFERMCR